MSRRSQAGTQAIGSDGFQSGLRFSHSGERYPLSDTDADGSKKRRAKLTHSTLSAQVACSLNTTRGWQELIQGWSRGREAALLSSIRFSSHTQSVFQLIPARRDRRLLQPRRRSSLPHGRGSREQNATQSRARQESDEKNTPSRLWLDG
jgi:hypothetical protein